MKEPENNETLEYRTELMKRNSWVPTGFYRNYFTDSIPYANHTPYDIFCLSTKLQSGLNKSKFYGNMVNFSSKDMNGRMETVAYIIDADQKAVALDEEDLSIFSKMVYESLQRYPSHALLLDSSISYESVPCTWLSSIVKYIELENHIDPIYEDGMLYVQIDDLDYITLYTTMKSDLLRRLQNNYTRGYIETDAEFARKLGLVLEKPEDPANETGRGVYKPEREECYFYKTWHELYLEFRNGYVSIKLHDMNSILRHKLSVHLNTEGYKHSFHDKLVIVYQPRDLIQIKNISLLVDSVDAYGTCGVFKDKMDNYDDFCRWAKKSYGADVECSKYYFNNTSYLSFHMPRKMHIVPETALESYRKYITGLKLKK